jgi:glyoxylase-like metal-dependent hydrolase (beta-lactamase superfamily II)
MQKALRLFVLDERTFINQPNALNGLLHSMFNPITAQGAFNLFMQMRPKYVQQPGGGMPNGGGGIPTYNLGDPQYLMHGGAEGYAARLAYEERREMLEDKRFDKYMRNMMMVNMQKMMGAQTPMIGDPGMYGGMGAIKEDIDEKTGKVVGRSFVPGAAGGGGMSDGMLRVIGEQNKILLQSQMDQLREMKDMFNSVLRNNQNNQNPLAIIEQFKQAGLIPDPAKPSQTAPESIETIAEELQRAHNGLQMTTTTEADSHFHAAQIPAYNVSQLPPIPIETFTQNHTLQVGNQTLLLNYHGNNHEEGNIFIYAPAQRTLMLVDVIFPGWVPFVYLALAEDVYGYIQAHDIVLNNYDFDTFVGGHLTRLGMREDVQLQREFITDLINASNRANQNVTFGEILQKVGGPTNNVWLLFNTYLNTVYEQCANEMLPKWEHRLGGVEEFLLTQCSTMTESLRIEPSTKTLEQEQQQ